MKSAADDQATFGHALAHAVVARRWWIVIAWAAVLVVAIFQARGLERWLYGSVGSLPGTESGRVEAILASDFDSPYAQFLVVTLEVPPSSKNGAVDGLGERIRIALSLQPYVVAVRALPEPDPRRAAWLVGIMASSLKQTEAVVVPVRQALAGFARSDPTAHITVTGQAAFSLDVVGLASKTAAKAERQVLPLTFLALLVSFGTMGAAILPVVAGVCAVLTSLGVLAVIARLMPLSVYATNIVTMLGLGLGIDYALFIVARVREEARSGATPHAAVVAAIRHASPAVAVSAGTLVIGLAGLASVPARESASMGIGGMVVGMVSAVAALTLLPALVALLGRGLDFPAALSRRLTGAATHQRWEALASWVLARPLGALFVSLAILLTLALPLATVELGDPEPHLLPHQMESVQGALAMQAMGLSGALIPVRLVLQSDDGGPMLTPKRLAALATMHRMLGADPRVDRVIALVDPATGTGRLAAGLALWGAAGVRRRLPADAGALISRDGRSLALTILLAPGQGLNGARAYVHDLHETDWRQRAGLDARVLVGGPPAVSAEFVASGYRHFPRVYVAIALATMAMMYLLTGSALIPLKAVLANTLTVAAAIGATQWLFCTPETATLIGMTGPSTTIPAGIPLITFCVVFGLSMDYEVFLISRILAAHRGGLSDHEAVVAGLGASGGVITSAALIMGIVFLGFALTPFLPIKLLGTALTLGVGLDATIVRLLLVPSLMVLAGRWNWWPAQPVMLLGRRATREGS